MTDLPPASASHPSALLDQRLARDPSSPLITFYDDATGERIELSATTFANWVAKTANLLRDGLGLDAHARVRLALPPHWQTLVVAHAAWSLGACVVTEDEAPASDVVFTTRDRLAQYASRSDEAVVLALRPMALPGDPVEAPIWDFDREVRAFGDRFAGAPIDPDDEAWIGTEHSSFRALVDRATRESIAAPSAAGQHRLAVETGSLDEAEAPLLALVALVRGSGIVLTTGSLDQRRLDQENALPWQPGTVH